MAGLFRCVTAPDISRTRHFSRCVRAQHEMTMEELGSLPPFTAWRTNAGVGRADIRCTPPELTERGQGRNRFRGIGACCGRYALIGEP